MAKLQTLQKKIPGATSDLDDFAKELSYFMFSELFAGMVAIPTLNCSYLDTYKKTHPNFVMDTLNLWIHGEFLLNFSYKAKESLPLFDHHPNPKLAYLDLLTGFSRMTISPDEIFGQQHQRPIILQDFSLNVKMIFDRACDLMRIPLDKRPRLITQDLNAPSFGSDLRDNSIATIRAANLFAYIRVTENIKNLYALANRILAPNGKFILTKKRINTIGRKMPLKEVLQDIAGFKSMIKYFSNLGYKIEYGLINKSGQFMERQNFPADGGDLEIAVVVTKPADTG